MTGSSTSPLDVVDLLYSAAMLDGAGSSTDVTWEAALGELGKACGAPSGVVLALTRGRLDFTQSVHVGFDASGAKDYASHYAALDPVLEPAISASTPGTLLFSDALIDGSTYLRSEFYNEWMRARGWFSGAAVPLLESGSARAVLYMARDRCAGPFSHDTIALLRAMVPHVQRAAQLALRLAANRVDRSTVSALDQASSGPIIVVDKLGVPVYANRAAERLLRIGDVLSIEPRHLGVQGAIRGTMSTVTGRLRSLIASACRSDAQGGSRIATMAVTHQGSGGSILLRGPEGKALLVIVAPMPIAAQQSDSLFHDLLPSQNERRAVLSIVDLSSPSTDALAQADASLRDCLVTHFGLTAAESEVASNIAGGLGLASVAELREVTLATVRTQAASVYQKLGVRGQTALASFVTRLSEKLAHRA